MCMKCGNEDKEICALCDAHYGKTGVISVKVILDSDTLGEIQTKLRNEVVDLMSRFMDQVPDKDICAQIMVLLTLILKSMADGLTVEDLEYIDCL